MTIPAPAPAESRTVAGWLCLEFTNTIDNYRLAEPTEFLGDYDALLRFGLRAGVMNNRTCEDLRARALSHAGDAGHALDFARGLRATLYRIFSALAHGKEPDRGDLSTLNRELSAAAAHREVVLQEGRFAWHWRTPVSSLEAPVWPVLQAAADLLTSPELGRLRQCSGHNCTWLFLDRSKNRSRRWCEMQVCGNRAKSRRHYARTRSRAGTS